MGRTAGRGGRGRGRPPADDIPETQQFLDEDAIGEILSEEGLVDVQNPNETARVTSRDSNLDAKAEMFTPPNKVSMIASKVCVFFLRYNFITNSSFITRRTRNELKESYCRVALNVKLLQELHHLQSHRQRDRSQPRESLHRMTP